MTTAAPQKPQTGAPAARPAGDLGPRLRALLDAVRGRLVRQVWLYGLGSAAVGFGLWLLFAYGLDRWLHLPRPIRMFHGLVLVAVPLWLLRRHLFALLGRVPDREGVALLIERRVPASEDRLVSAVQLAGLAGDPVRGDLVQRVQREAEDVAGSLSTEAIFEPSKPRVRFAQGFGAVAVALGALGAEPEMARIFAQRMLGQEVSWPRRTTLFVEVAAGDSGARITETADEISVLVPRGANLELLVRAEGVAPDFVTVEFDDGTRDELNRGTRDTFRTLLRALQQDMSFTVVGGDDRRGEPRVVVQVLQPPDVGGVAFHVQPPAYTGLDPRIEVAPEVDVPEGSAVTVHVLPDPATATGMARTFPDSVELALAPRPWPLTEGEAGTALGLAFELVADESSRFRFELVDDAGLTNPDPGLFGVQVTPDRRPELTLLAPAQATMEVVAGGALPMRLRVLDDHGVADVTFAVQDARGEGAALLQGALALREVQDAPPSVSGSPRGVVASGRIEIDDLGRDATGSATPLALGQSFTLVLTARDGREPSPGESLTAPITVRVVSVDDLQRGIREGLTRIGEDAEDLVRLVEQLGLGLRDAELALSGETAEADAGLLVGLTADARRAQGDARGIARDVAALAERMLYSRVDERSSALLERLERLYEDVDDRGFPVTAWRSLSDEYAAGTLGQAELAGELVALVGLALDVADPRAEAVAGALQLARESDDLPDIRARVADARARHAELVTAADDLLSRLAEWNDFQSVLGLTRDLLRRQRNLTKRIGELSKED